MKINELAVAWQMALDEQDFPLYSAAIRQISTFDDVDTMELMEIHSLAHAPMKDIIKQTGTIRNFSQSTRIPYHTCEGWSRKPCPDHIKYLTCIALGLLRVD